MVERKNDLLHLALEQGDLVGQTVDSNDLLGLADDGRHIDTNDMLCAGLSGEPVYSVSALARVMCGGVARGARVHGEDTGTAANIEDNLVLEEVGVLVNGVAVASCADFILLNLLSASASGFTWDGGLGGLPAFPRGCLHARVSTFQTKQIVRTNHGGCSY